MSSIKLTLKLFRSNLKQSSLYLLALALAAAMYYDFSILKYSPEVLGGERVSTSVVVCAMLMSLVMVIVLFAFVWSSSRFFLQQRKKEIGLYALCGVPMGRAARVFVWDALLTGLCALAGGIALGTVLTKLFLMGAAKMIQLERAMGFTFSMAALVETCAVVMAIFACVAVRNAVAVRRSTLIDLLQGMRQHEQPPKRRAVRAVLGITCLLGGYGLSLMMNGALLIFLAVPVLLLVVAGTYWSFEALLPAVLGGLIGNKQFSYRGMRLVPISNLWYRLRLNYRNLALTSVLSATAVVTLCTALTMSSYVGANESEYGNRLWRAYSATAFMDADKKGDVQAALRDAGVVDAQWTEVARVKGTGEGSYTEIVMSQSEAQAACDRAMALANLERVELNVPEGGALTLQSPNSASMLIEQPDEYEIKIGGEALTTRKVPLAWPFGSNDAVWTVYVVPDGFLASLDPARVELRPFLALTVGDQQIDALEPALSGMDGVSFVSSRMLTTESRILYGTLGYLGMIMFGVFSLLTGCALLFKQLSEAVADRDKYRALAHLGATKGELMRTVAAQVGLGLLVPLALGVVHAAFAVRVMGSLFLLDTARFLAIAVGVYGLVALGLYGLTVQRFMRVTG